MANVFQRAETVICSALVKTTAGVLTTPATSMTITISDPVGTAVIAGANMTLDAVGTYHYDFAPAATATLGIYLVRYVATDGTRKTIQDDSFVLE